MHGGGAGAVIDDDVAELVALAARGRREVGREVADEKQSHVLFRALLLVYTNKDNASLKLGDLSSLPSFLPSSLTRRSCPAPAPDTGHACCVRRPSAVGTATARMRA